MLKRRLAGRSSLAATTASGTLIAALIATVAVVSGGYTAQKIDLNDGSVWVANGEARAIGRANTQVLELNSIVAAESGELDVVQRGSHVLLLDRGNSRVDVIDPATSSVLDGVPMPTNHPQVYLAGANAVVTDADGRVWFMSGDELSDFDLESQPSLSLGGESVFSLDGEGTLVAYSRAAGTLYRIAAAGDGSVVETVNVSVGGVNSELSVSRVGAHWIILDATTRILHFDDRELDLSGFIAIGDSPKLQGATASGEAVLIAYRGGLLEVQLTTGEPTALLGERAGFPAVPVELDGCRFAAWSDGTGWKQCAGEPPAPLQQLDGMPLGAAQLTFNVNGDRIVLNDPHGGGTWAVQRSGELIDNWEQLVRTLEDERTVVVDDPDADIEYERVQKPPVAIDDEFGARPGRSTILSVLLNDHDPNGDVLAVSSVTAIDSSIGRLDLVNNRQQVQLTLAANATGMVVFDYTVTDGRGGEDTARVTVTIRNASENSAPRQVSPSRALVAQGGRVTTPVLGDWFDPDGDAIYLVAASVAPPDLVSFTPEGSVIFTEGGGAGSQRTVSLVVSDGREQSTGTLTVAVSPPGDVPIIAEGFIVLAYAGQEVRVAPLEHVRGGTGQVRLSSVSSATGATVTANLEKGTFRFMSDQPRVYHLEYVVNDGTQTATGIVRIDVAAPPDANTAPIAVPKTVFVRVLGSQTIDVAATDIDPAGGVLLVTAAYNVPEVSGVKVEVIEQRSLRVTLTAPLDHGPVTFNYRVSNGLAEAEGEVTVVQIPRPARLQPPVAVHDTISVRVGAVIDIPVLDNDIHPDGEELTLEKELATPIAGDSGLLFVSGTVLRFLAPEVPGNVSATYTVSGPDGQTAQARVDISVRERIDATNRPPSPVTVIARVLAGDRVSIPIPLVGIDPDGDTVQLLGQESNPQRGAVVGVTQGGLVYEAGEYSAGTDTFRYTVIDALGARASGTVRVGISPRLEGARNPVATADDVSMRPGGSVTVPVLANDSDPDGSVLRVISLEPNNAETVAETDGEFVTVTPPRRPGQYSVIYTIQNEFGGTSSAFLTVNVDASAPPAYPSVTDAVLTLTDILDLDEVDVNVLAGAFYAEGPVSSLTVSLLPGYDSAASVTADKRVRVTIGNRSQIIPFSVAAPDDASLVAYAFVWVPGYNDALPQIDRRAKPLTIPSESPLTIRLNDYVVAIGGAPVRLVDGTTVQATHSNGDPLVVDDTTLVFTSADKYFGPASISFQVTDGVSANDPDGRVATLVLPIEVTPRENQPPVFNGGVIEFEPAQEKVLDLVKLTTYPYPDDVDELAYTALAPLPVGFSYTLTGQQLVIRADADAVKGTRTAIVLGVRDGLAEGKAGRIELAVVPSSRPLAVPAADTFVAPRGTTTTIDVLANDQATNPFPGRPLIVTEVRGIGGDVPSGVSIVPSADSRRLSVTVSSDAAAQDISLQYRVLDATLDPDRAVWGVVRVQIQDVPDAVTGAHVASFGDSRLTVAFNPGSFNNSPITGYEITTTRADSGSLVGTTTCTITSGCDVATPGNGPAHAVRVSIVAVNSLGRSASSAVPGSVWSDVLPAAPAGVTAVPTNVAADGGSLHISWSAVPDPAGGSSVVGYTVRITGPGVALSPSVSAGTTSLNYANSAGLLKPNVQYSVVVYARNSAQVASDSAWLRTAPATVTTVGPPGKTASGVSAVVVNAQGHIRVTWGASAPNGAPGVSYSVGRFAASQEPPATCRAPTPGSGGAVDSGWIDSAVSDGATYRYAVYSDNGLYCTVTVSGSVLTMLAPGQASASASLNARNGRYDVRVDALSVASLDAARYQYRIGDGAWHDVAVGQWITSSADASVYGTKLDIVFRGCRDETQDFCGQPSGVLSIRPVNVRADIAYCRAGEPVTVNAPNNNGHESLFAPSYSFHDGGDTSEWSPFGPDSTAPAPASAESAAEVRVRVKATVHFGPDIFTDPEYIEESCAP